VPGLAFGHFFRAAVMESDIGNNVNDVLAIELQYQAQDTVCTRMLRSDIEKHKIRIIAVANHSPLFRLELQGSLFAVYFFIMQPEGSEFGCPGWMFLAERVTLPGLWHKYPAQV
jgi:hypothetical protein